MMSKLKLRYVFALLIALLANRVVVAQSVGDFNALWNAINASSGDTTINLSRNLTGTATDEDGEKIDFLLDDAISARTVSIVSGGRSITYASAPTSDTSYLFNISIGAGGRLLFTDAANVSGGYSGEGAFYIADGVLEFRANANLHDNVSSSSGGAAYAIASAGQAAIRVGGALTLKSNTADGDGGGFALANDGSILSVTGAATLESNRALYGGGGAIYGQSTAMTFASTLTATGNQAAGDGGVFFLDGSATLDVTGVATFTKNSAEYDFAEDDDNSSYGGGAIYANSSSAIFKDEAIFGYKADGDRTKNLGNMAKTAGGAILAEGDSTFRFDKIATFGGNKVSAGSGGAVHLTTGEINFVQGATFQYNEAGQGDGGAVYSSTGKMVFGGPAIFRNNTATGGDYGGGAIYADIEAVLNFTDVTFENNKAVTGEAGLVHGGAAYLTGLGAPANDPIEYGWKSTGVATLTGNDAAGNGGAMFIEASAVQFATAQFSNNISRFVYEDGGDFGGGGAIFVDSGSVLHFENKATFANNTALSAYGGAIFATGNGTVDPDDPVAGIHFKNGAEFTGNKAINGGAVYLEDSVVTFGGVTTISGNEATDSGGAFYAQGSSQLHFEAGSTTTIANNKSTGKGGAIAVADAGTLTVKLDGASAGTTPTTVTIAAGNSTAANDVYIGADATLDIYGDANSKLYINSALAGAARAAGDTTLNIYGSGYVELNGDASGFQGDLLVEGGTFKLGLGAGTLGDLYNSSISVTGGGKIIVALNQDSTPGLTDKGRLQGASINLDSEGQQILISMESFITDSSTSTGYALISTTDASGESLLQDYIDSGVIVGNNFDSSKLQSDIRSELDAEGNEIWTLYVWVYFDPNDPNMPWKFNVGSGTETMDILLDNTNATYPGNAGKTLEVNGQGTLHITKSGNKVSGLLGNGNIQLDSALTLNGQQQDGKTLTYTGTLIGEGDIVKTGGYTQQILGKNDHYQGDFDVQQGTLQGNTDSLRNNVTVAQGATLSIDQETLSNITETPERVLNATLQGGGLVQIHGVNDIGTTGITDSVVKIDRDQKGFTGNMFVDRGWVLVADKGDLSGIAGANKISIGPNGGLGGNGLVGNVALQKGGAIQAYNGSLNVAGNLDISGGIVYVMMTGTQNADIIDVTGTVTISADSRFEIAGIAGDYREGERFVFLEAGAIDIEGDVSSTTYVDGSGQTWTFHYDLDDDGNLVAWASKGGTPPPPPPRPVVKGLTWNRAQVAGALTVLGPLGTTPQPMKDFIVQLNTHKKEESGNTTYDSTYQEATRQLAGSIRADGIQLGLYSPYRTVFNRLSLGSELYSSAPIIYNNGYGAISGLENSGAGAGPVTYRGQDEYGNPMLNPHFDNGAAICDIPGIMGENNFWADVTHVQSKIKGDGNSDKYGMSRTGLLLGMDFQKMSNSRVGLLFGYFSPYLWQNNDRVEAEDYHAGLYFQQNHRGADWYAYFGYAHQEYDSRRFVNMGIVDPSQFGLERYEGGTRGDSFNMSIEASRPRYYGNNYILRPLIGLDYYYTAQNGYRETGPAGGQFGLRYDKATNDQLFLRIGANLKRETDFTSMVLRAQYIYQFETDSHPSGDARFLQTGSPTMSIRGVNLGEDYLNLGAGLNIFMNASRSRFMSFDYDFNLSKRLKSHGVSLILIERF